MVDIPVSRVAAMGMFEGQSQSVGFVRNHNQVNVIRHEAIADEGELVQSSIVSEQVKINKALGVGSEDELPGVPTLCNVVRYINGNHASQTSHGTQSNRKRGKRPVCPRVSRRGNRGDRKSS